MTGNVDKSEYIDITILRGRFNPRQLSGLNGVVGQGIFHHDNGRENRAEKGEATAGHLSTL